LQRSANRPWYTGHPHWCRELSDNLLVLVVGCGSSPRVWGTQFQYSGFLDNFWFIPTGVGNFPRRIIIGVVAPGSSPRVWGTRSEEGVSRSPLWFIPTGWGTQQLTSIEPSSNRVIPTGVGNTFQCSLFWFALVVNPHGCGELMSPTSG